MNRTEKRKLAQDLRGIEVCGECEYLAECHLREMVTRETRKKYQKTNKLLPKNLRKSPMELCQENTKSHVGANLKQWPIK